MRTYRALNNQVFTSGKFSIVPIRYEDRFEIMKWRNEQIYHLRQNQPLTKETQESYFSTVVESLYHTERPNNVFFSFLERDKCIGYGGLVHMNWTDKNAEISFIMETSLEEAHFEFYWGKFLSLIEVVAFKELRLHKVYTCAFDLRPLLYNALLAAQFHEECRMKEHCLFEGKFVDQVIHSKFGYNLREAVKEDVELTFKWARNRQVRKYAFSQERISSEDHHSWFISKLNDHTCFYLILEFNMLAVGSIRIDIDDHSNGEISYLIDPQLHGLGLGKVLIENCMDYISTNQIPVTKLVGRVQEENIASIRTFEKLEFIHVGNEDKGLVFQKTF